MAEQRDFDEGGGHLYLGIVTPHEAIHSPGV